MGCFCSNISENSDIYNEVPQLRQWMREFYTLALSEAAVEKFYRIYKKIDMDRSGTIEIKEMLVHFDIDRTKFTKRVFGVFDEDNSGEIDLREFILALWNYCTLGKSTLVIFAFDLYDTDGSGVIDAEELDNMLKEVYGRLWHTNVYATRIAQNIQGIAHAFIDIESFGNFVKKHPALLFPAYDMQRKLQKFTLGQAYWKRLADKRLRLSNGEFVPIKKFMDMHLEKLINEDKTKYQTERMLTYAKSTTIESKSDKPSDSKAATAHSESSRNSAANKELMPRRMSSVAVELGPSKKEPESNKSSHNYSSKSSSIYLPDAPDPAGHSSTNTATDMSTETPQTDWVSSTKSSKGKSKKRRSVASIYATDHSPQYYKGDALQEALRMRQQI